MKLAINFKKYWDWDFNKNALKMMLPLVFQSIFIALTNILDTIFIAHYNPEALTALGITNDLFILLIYSFWSVSSVGGIYTTQYLGKKNFVKVKETTKIKLILVLILAIFYFTLLSLIKESVIDFLLTLDASISIKSLELTGKAANDYLTIINYTTWFVGISLIFYNSMYECGYSWSPLVINFIVFLINLILDPIFIKVLDWGVSGAAWATFIARVVELIIIISVMFYFKHIYVPDWKLWKTSWDLWKKVLRNFIFILLANALFAVSTFIQKMIILKEGYKDYSYQAAILTFSIIGLFYSFFNGYFVIIPYFIGRALGANKIKLAKEIFYKILMLGIILNGTIALIIIVISPFVFNFVKLQDHMEDVVYVAKYYLAFQGIAFFFLSTSILLFNVLRIGGRNFISSVIDILCTWVFIIALTWLAFFLFKRNLTDVEYEKQWISISIWVFLIISLAEIIQLSILVIVFQKVKWANNLVTNKITEKIIEPVEKTGNSLNVD